MSKKQDAQMINLTREISILSQMSHPSVVELEDGWCTRLDHLTEVEVDRGNARYSRIGGKPVIGKSDISNEDYDTLIFCTRDSIEANIPATIKIIGAFSFSNSKFSRIQIPSHVTQICEGAFSCFHKLSRFEFEPNSELRTIGEGTFFYSALASIQIPSHVTQICERAFCKCDKLQIVEIDENSLEESIGVDTFRSSEIIMLPVHEKQKIHNQTSTTDQ